MILRGDCLEVLKTLPENSVDSLVTDPPAGISFMAREWDDHKGGRKEWIAWLASVMTEAKRVLKPGAHALVWSIPRTSHWTGTALEEAGFEVRDCIYHHFGSGFPKSKSFRTIGHPELGTALKPSTEHWWLVRKPISERNLDANVLRWGTGALQIDASRIYSDAQRPDTKALCEKSQDNLSASIAGKLTQLGEADSLTDSATKLAGDFPNDAESTTLSGSLIKPDTSASNIGATNEANTAIFLNTDMSGNERTDLLPSAMSFITEMKTSRITDSKTSNLCPEIGTVPCITDDLTYTPKNQNQATTLANGKSEIPGIKKSLGNMTENAAPGRFPSNLILSCTCGDCEDGQIPLFHEDGCVVKEIDTQSGVSKSTGGHTTKFNKGNIYGKYGDKFPANSGGLGDSGGAARFFYVAKASKRERNAGLEGMPEREKKTLNDYVSPSEGRTASKSGAPSANHHPTVKPQKLMQYLIRLITPPGGTVIDCFAGSGSTGVAAAALGFNFIGIEREAEYAEIAEKRFEHAKANA